MDFLRDVKRRAVVSAMAGMLVCILALGRAEYRMPLAWWGFLYPEYCFMEVDESKYDIEQQSGKIKISFWLAKVFDW